MHAVSTVFMRACLSHYLYTGRFVDSFSSSLFFSPFFRYSLGDSSSLGSIISNGLR